MDWFAFAQHIHLGTFRWRTFGKGWKYWLAEWINHLSITTYIGDGWPNQPDQRSVWLINRALRQSIAQYAQKATCQKNICRLCNENLRIKGTLTGVRFIFQRKDPQWPLVASHLNPPQNHSFGKRLQIFSITGYQTDLWVEYNGACEIRMVSRGYQTRTCAHINTYFNMFGRNQPHRHTCTHTDTKTVGCYHGVCVRGGQPWLYIPVGSPPIHSPI